MTVRLAHDGFLTLFGWYVPGGGLRPPVKVRHNCWCCGRFIWNQSKLAYACPRCEVAWQAASAVVCRAADLEQMARFGLIDHGSVHLPSPA
ncbi:MAG: hypothetical protein ACLQDY_11005 [Streptosporangiaceae bacterium]